ncbi:MAG: YfhO family protein, partial [Pisciglobus halotolerans]|nr:YfhO family protein [Pisciglobus halotolerans]
MKNKTADYLKKQWALILSFFIPLLIMLVIHAFKGVYPFGDSSLLTIDLGQQYIDFFSYYRETLLHDPGSLFYSFAKSIGGDMISLWAYYLTSPLNLIFLLLPQSQLSLGVTIITLLKYSLSGLSMAYFLKKAFNGEGLLLVSFAISYALMGYTVVNQFNIMWLDGIILLPLVALGIEYLVFLKRGRFYTLALALALFANYYIGYMI